ncbi:MAG: pyruvate dehydrogenase complex dihydrolipoamide acetyltransferase [Geminicoccaceae bacterium]|nr:MAG: pyruvate dehydrogenase complex dihydrolipoamide acetyltransferase [Geminicoccaceae bacterium]
MPIEILMPALSPTMTEGTLAAWHKAEGDAVKAGDVLAEIETDKATMEVEAVDEGTLGKILVPAGADNVAVNTPIALLLEEGEDAASLADAQAKRPKEAAPTAPEPSETKMPEPQPATSTAATGDRIAVSPLAKRMAAQAGLDLAKLTGTGPHGRIIKVDVEAAIAKGAGKAAAEAKPAAEAPAAPAPASRPAAPPKDAYEEVRLDNMRKTIARRLAESKREVPHFYLSVDVELDALLALRAQLNARPGAETKISVNDFVIKACAHALKRVPDANASFGGDKLYKYTHIDISVAVAIPGGLITPIVREADKKGLGAISAEMKDLAARARDGKLQPEEYQGGGFSISNLGMYGIKDFMAVINPPQACILAVGAGEQRAIVKDGALAIATVMTLTLSVDHRVVDGALAADVLQHVKRGLEDPLALLL